ncbi:MAG: hypothetical protein PUB20_07070 [Clostridia bacterium]|nr:hypothetical protein [Clostridia bacterium]
MGMNSFSDFSSMLDKIGKSDESGKKQAAQDMINSLNSEQTKELNEIMQDSDKLRAILNSPAAKKIFEKINGNGNGKSQ